MTLSGSVMTTVVPRWQTFMNANTMQATRRGRLLTDREVAKPLADQVRPCSPSDAGVAFLVKGFSCSVVDVRGINEYSHAERLRVRHGGAGDIPAVRCASRRAGKVKCAVCWPEPPVAGDPSSSAGRKPMVGTSSRVRQATNSQRGEGRGVPAVRCASRRAGKVKYTACWSGITSWLRPHPHPQRAVTL